MAESKSSHGELMAWVSRIPQGKVACYGDLGKALSRPVSGLIVGRWMAQATEGVPWWRVVAKDGSLPVNKRGVYLAMEQKELLQSEGVEFYEDRVRGEFFWSP